MLVLCMFEKDSLPGSNRVRDSVILDVPTSDDLLSMFYIYCSEHFIKNPVLVKYMTKNGKKFWPDYPL